MKNKQSLKTPSKRSQRGKIKFSVFDEGLEKGITLRNTEKGVVALGCSSSAMISRGKEE
jgi:hypothetical protein